MRGYLDVEIHVQNATDRDYVVRLLGLTAKSTASLDSFVSSGSTNADVRFGERESDGSIRAERIIYKGGKYTNFHIMIVDDFISEDEECFTIQLLASPLDEDNFTCSEDDNEMDYFCFQTICIEDDDG